MPAITVPDITALPRIPDPDALTARERHVKSVTRAPSGFEGEGFPVRRAFAGVDLGVGNPGHDEVQAGEPVHARRLYFEFEPVVGRKKWMGLARDLLL